MLRPCREGEQRKAGRAGDRGADAQPRAPLECNACMVCVCASDSKVTWTSERTLNTPLPFAYVASLCRLRHPSHASVAPPVGLLPSTCSVSASSFFFCLAKGAWATLWRHASMHAAAAEEASSPARPRARMRL